jgi:hypothetical protein
VHLRFKWWMMPTRISGEHVSFINMSLPAITDVSLRVSNAWPW